jgi:glucose-6-phosphate-specific signal transduction histidine kinase
MLTYIAIILTVHTLIGLYSVISTSVRQRKYEKTMQTELEERNRVFDEIIEELESEVKRNG